MVSPRTRLTDRFVLIGNHGCLDFVNTEAMQKGERLDFLAEFADLAAWLRAAQLLGPTEADEAIRRWGGTPAGARALVEARKLRASLRQMLEQTAQDQPVSPSTVETINALLARPIGHGELVRSGEGFVRRLRFGLRTAVDLLVPVAEAAADLLCHADLSLVRKCENPACVRYFYDVSKNHGRRWCSMAVCGNRMKVAAYHRRAQRRRRPRS